MSILCTICLRGGSKGVPGKNSRHLNGKPLMDYTIEQAIECGLFENIVVSTDSETIAENARRLGIDVWFTRPAELSTDKAAKVPVIIHALHESEKYYKKTYSVVMDLDGTSPLRKVSDIENSLKQFQKSDANNLVTVCKSRKNPYFNMIEKRNDRYKVVIESDTPINRRQDAPEVYEMNASIYIWKRHCLLEENRIINTDTDCYIMPEERSVDIDTEADFNYVEYLMAKSKD